MEPLSLRFVGWFFTLVPGAAMFIGGLILYMLFRSGGLARRYAEQSLLNDLTLMVVWIAGLAGGIGVLKGKAWSLWLLEFFCWVLCVMVILSGVYRLLALNDSAGKKPGSWMAAIAGVLLVAIPILAFCAATIYTLRSDAARQALTG